MNWKQIITTVVLCVAVSFAVVSFKAPSGTVSEVKKETAYERVLRTNTLRCAYGSIFPDSYKDAKDGKIKGHAVDIAEEMAQRLGLKVEWVAEVGFPDFAEGFKTGKYDAFCGALGRVPTRARSAILTAPIMYYPLYAYVRENENRFTGIKDLNSSGIKAGTIDGEIVQILTRKYLPNAQEYSLSALSSDSELFLSLSEGKIDTVIHIPSTAGNYNKNNEKKIARLSDEYFEVTPSSFAVGANEYQLANMLNTSIETMHTLGIIDKILTGHGLDEATVYRVAKPFVKL